jgi:hypothetical protein
MSKHPTPRANVGSNDAWAETRAATTLATKVMGDEEDYLATTRRAIGRRIDAERHEMFVVCDPAEALQQQFEHHAPEFIVLHDLGLEGSVRLLQGVAAATQRPMQQLVVRRQGFGSALATLRFVELPGSGASAPVRIYSTRVDAADPAQATALQQTLLGHSRLGVILVGAQAVAEAAIRLRPLRDAMAETAWRNRELLWLPIGADAAAAAPGSLAGRHSPVNLHTAPTQADLGQAWPVISAHWDRLRQAPHDPHAAAGLAMPPMRSTAPSLPRVAPSASAQARRPLAPPAAPTARGEFIHSTIPGDFHSATEPMAFASPSQRAPEPASLRAVMNGAALPARSPAAALGVPPAPALATRAPPPAPPVAPNAPAVAPIVDWAAYVRECAALPGLLSCCVFDLASERPLAHVGSRPGPAALAAQGAALYEALCHSARALGLAPGLPEMALTLAEHHLILHPLAQHPGLALHAVLDAHLANLTLLRMKLHRLDPGSPFAGTH